MRRWTLFVAAAGALVVGGAVWAVSAPLLLDFMGRYSFRDRAPTNPAVLMTLERTACFGTCPIYRVVVFKDGRIEYPGEQYVKVVGQAQRRLGAQELSDIPRAFSEAGFCLLDAEYVRIEVTDAQFVFTSFSGCDPPVAVKHYHGDTRAPEKLGELEKRLDRILETDRWVGTEAEREVLQWRWWDERRASTQR